MKLFKLLAFFLFISLFLFGGIKSANAAFAPWRPLCVGIQGKFVAKNWKGGPIEVGCVGDDGGATNQADQRCTGEVQVVEPNTEFRLTKCSCWGSNKGCLKVGKDITLNPLNSNNRKTITIVKSIKDTAAFKNNSCTINSTQIGNYCAANGSHLLDKNVKIVCEAPPTPTRSVTNTPTPTRNPSHTPTPTSRNTPTPTLPICVGPEKVTNVEVTCRNCANGQGATVENPDISWKVNGMELSANNAYVEIGNTNIPIMNDATLDGSTTPFNAGDVYKQELEGTWHGVNGINGVEVSMLLSFRFEYTPNQGWEVTEITTSDGDDQGSSFIKFGPKTKTGDTVQNSIGDYYINRGSPTEFVSEDGKNTIHFENLQIGAFLNGVN